MIRDIITNKWFIGAIAFLIIFAGACYLWYRYDTAPYRQETAEAVKLLRQQEAAKKVDTVNEAEQAVDAIVESNTPTAEKSINGSTAEVENNTEADKQQSDTPAETQAAADVHTSLYGLGAYPEIPKGFYSQDPEVVFGGGSIEFELMARVRIELFKRGIITTSVTMSDQTGLVYPIVEGEVYVSWGYGNFPGIGEQRYAVEISGSRKTMSRIRNNVRNRESPLPVEIRQITELDIPQDVVVKTVQEGIEPYKFLSLKQP